MLATVIGMLVLATVVAFTFWPNPVHQGIETDVDAPVAVLITLDSFDAARGVVTVSVQAAGDTSAVEEDVVTVFTDIAGVEPIRLPESNFTAPESGDIRVDSADLVSYPFDDYDFEMTIAAFTGDPLTDVDPAGLSASVPVPIEVQVIATISGFRTTATVTRTEDVPTVAVELTRPRATRVWASAMMAIFWLLAIAAMAVVVATLAGLLAFETRHLAWLTAMIFAFAAFRNTAPGSPPIGVFVDFAAFFWAVGIVVLAELLLLTHYLFGRHDGTSSARDV